jgi:hypothetical protein
MMNGIFLPKQQTGLVATILIALAASSALAADLSGVTVVPDRDVAARTNMTRSASDTSTLGVSFDADVAKRTNMQRQPADVAPVKVIQDKAVMERTNMGDSARNKSGPLPAKEAASNPSATPATPANSIR